MQKGHAGMKFATLHKFGSRKRKLKWQSVTSKLETTPAEPQPSTSKQSKKMRWFLVQRRKYESSCDSDQVEEAKDTGVEQFNPHQQVIQEDTNLIVDVKCLQSLIKHFLCPDCKKKVSCSFFFFFFFWHFYFSV